MKMNSCIIISLLMFFLFISIHGLTIFYNSGNRNSGLIKKRSFDENDPIPHDSDDEDQSGNELYSFIIL